MLCDCAKCNGAPVTFSEFEMHAGSNNRRPGECIIIRDCDATLKARQSAPLRELCAQPCRSGLECCTGRRRFPRLVYQESEPWILEPTLLGGMHEQV